VPFVLLTILTLTTGTAFIMWLGEQISDRGIGNGISLIIFAGIVVNLPNASSRRSACSAIRPSRP
jgi:preprotein translocase subunit SecY